MNDQDSFIKPGRPRLQVDHTLVLRLRDVEHLGWSRGAKEYRKRTGQRISRDTFKRRYFVGKVAGWFQSANLTESKVIDKSPLDKFVDYTLVLRLRDVEHLGWSRGAEEYRKRTGQWISRDTFEGRYYVGKIAGFS